MALRITHEFKTCDNDEKAIQNSKEANICVGSTGTGKSSLIELFTGIKAAGHETESKTTESSLIPQRNSNTKYWLDSQGANDSNGTDDQKVLTDILKKLYDEQIANIKVIWCVSGDMCREKEEFQRQAAFIKSLGDNVWRSCLIIKKQGTPQPKKINGVLAAANRYDANIENNDNYRLFGYTGLEFGDHSDDAVYELCNEEKDLTERHRKYRKYGYFTNTEIVTEVTQKLSRLPSLHIVFTIERCSKCGVIGDPRFIYAPCHSALEKYHPQPNTVPYHSGAIRHVHTAGIQRYHSGHIQTTYTKEWYHPGKIDNHVARNMVGHLFTFGIHTVYRAATDTFDSWSCCDKKTSAGGCTERITGAITKFSCCGGASNSAGCQQRYGCCSRGVGSTGCRAEWNCCSAVSSNVGCKRMHPCCSRDLGSIGCRDRCQSCHRAWGASTGCTRTTARV